MIEINMTVYNEALPYIAEALMRNGTMAKDMEALYAKDKVRFYRIYKDYEANFENSSFRTGTLERELYLKHCLGILLAAQEDGALKAKLMKRYEKVYQQLFILAKKGSAKLFDHVLEQADKTIAQSNAASMLGYYFLVLTHGTHIEAPEPVEKLVRITEGDIVARRACNNRPFDFENSIGENIETVSAITKKYKAIKSCADIRTHAGTPGKGQLSI